MSGPETMVESDHLKVTSKSSAACRRTQPRRVTQGLTGFTTRTEPEVLYASDPGRNRVGGYPPGVYRCVLFVMWCRIRFVCRLGVLTFMQQGGDVDPGAGEVFESFHQSEVGDGLGVDEES